MSKSSDPNCICYGNWRTLVKECEHLLDRKFQDKEGKVYTFYGLVHGSDDYYYGMASKGNGTLLSCVGNLESHGFTLCADEARDGPYLTVDMPDGSVWGVPVEIIALNRAAYYADREFDGDVQRSLKEDTLPLFSENAGAIEDWAVGNMDWDDFSPRQVLIRPAPAPDFQEAWMSGSKSITGPMR